ncbi:MAG: DNA repair protein, partial [Atopostipes sp.]|nr:DNA repair protein [Atopostipes sp.]
IEIKTLSRGTAEPLYIAIRLAYIVKVQDLIKLPIIMDDPFVNFDDERKENMYNLLHHLADHTQIIYFSFDSDIEKYFTDHEIHYLERG